VRDKGIWEVEVRHKDQGVGEIEVCERKRYVRDRGVREIESV